MPDDNKEAERLRNRLNYLANKELFKQKAKQWAEANPERRREIARESRRRNYQPGSDDEKRVASARASAWQRANREKVNAKNRSWRAANSDKARASREKWKLANRDKAHEIKQTRRARELGAFVEVVNRITVYENGNGICGICKKPVSLSSFHVDHIIPISRGGLHCYGNTQPAHPSCNLRKSNKIA
jgi:5-methylcytosine-specific restriction endonuclease McrA